jgi:small subunit ribosomal protein S8
MSQTDPISDMLARMRNAQMALKDTVEIPHSRMKEAIIGVLHREGFIKDFAVEGDGARKALRVFLKYTGKREGVIQGLRRDSKPGRRLYAAADEIPRVLGGMGVTVMSTSAGVMSGREARERRLGGELLCSIW